MSDRKTFIALSTKHVVNLEHIEHIEIDPEGSIIVQMRSYQFRIRFDDPDYKAARNSLKGVFGI